MKLHRAPIRLFVVGATLRTAAAVVAPAFQLAQRPAAAWIQRLERPERVAGQKGEEVIARLDLRPGLVVADIGAGTGVFSRPVAKVVAPGGKVYAVDIEQELLAVQQQVGRRLRPEAA